MKHISKLIVLVFPFVLVACYDNGTNYTLYRSGIDLATNTADISMRIHIATFDAKDDRWSAEDQAKYNQANCDFAQELFTAKQPHVNGTALGPVKMKYWCEKGGYKK